jgi:hypothetical protein
MEAAGSFDHWYLSDCALSPLQSILQKKSAGSFEASPVYQIGHHIPLDYNLKHSPY